MIRAQQAPTVSHPFKATSPSMTVPAFSLPAVLPGAPSSPMGIGAAAPSGAAGLFEGLLAGAVQAEQGGRPQGKGVAADRTLLDRRYADETILTADAGVTPMLFAPTAVPIMIAGSTPPHPADAEAPAAAATASTGPAGRGFMSSGAPASAQVAANDLFGDLDLLGADDAGQATPAEDAGTPAVTGRLGDLARFTLDADGAPAPARSAAPATPATPAVPAARDPATGAVTPAIPAIPSSQAAAAALAAPARSPVRPDAAVAPTPAAVPSATTPATRAAAATPVPLAPPVAVAAVAQPVAAAALAADAVEAAVPAPVAPAAPAPLKTAATEGETRRSQGVGRADRRDAATGGAPAISPFAPKSERAAAAADVTTTSAETAADVETALEPAVHDAPEAPDARQPALPAETRVQTAQAAAAAADAAVTRGSPETVAKMAADIVRKLDGQSSRFDVQLDPHGMGKVDVAIEIDRDGKLTAALSFDSAQSASDLRGRAGELRLALEQAGFDIAEGGLTFDLSGQNAGFSGREAGQQERAWNGRAFQRAQSGADEADTSLAAAPSTPSRRTRSGVDIRI